MTIACIDFLRNNKEKSIYQLYTDTPKRKSQPPKPSISPSIRTPRKFFNKNLKQNYESVLHNLTVLTFAWPRTTRMTL